MEGSSGKWASNGQFRVQAPRTLVLFRDCAQVMQLRAANMSPKNMKPMWNEEIEQYQHTAPLAQRCDQTRSSVKCIEWNPPSQSILSTHDHHHLPSFDASSLWSNRIDSITRTNLAIVVVGLCANGPGRTAHTIKKKHELSKVIEIAAQQRPAALQMTTKIK